MEPILKRKTFNFLKRYFSWSGYWSDRTLFHQENLRKYDNDNNDTIADKNNVSKVKYKLINHYKNSNFRY